MAKKMYQEGHMYNAGRKRNDIIAAALKLFLQYGYEGTSIRMILHQVDSDVGLFYYYFRNKDEVFTEALDLFFNRYKSGFTAQVALARRDPYRAFPHFFEYVEFITIDFRNQFGDGIHWTVRLSVRERMLELIEMYFREILDITIQFGARPQLSKDVAAAFIAHGVCSTIVHGDTGLYTRRRKEIDVGVNLIMGLDARQSAFLRPEYATEKDLPACEAIFAAYAAQFPSLSEETFRTLLKKGFREMEVLVIRQEDTPIGVLVFSQAGQELKFLAVAEEYRRRGVASRLLICFMAEFPVNTELYACVHRLEKGAARPALAFLRRVGFHEEIEREYGSCRQFTIFAPETVCGFPGSL